jgi:hypothetical protein
MSHNKIIKTWAREKRINDALRYYGLSVIIRTEDEFNHIKKFLSEDVLWVDFVPQMSSKLTAIVIWSDMKELLQVVWVALNHKKNTSSEW